MSPNRPPRLPLDYAGPPTDSRSAGGVLADVTVGGLMIGAGSLAGLVGLGVTAILWTGSNPWASADLPWADGSDMPGSRLAANGWIRLRHGRRR